jgi:predicted nucleic acid-binding protein
MSSVVAMELRVGCRTAAEERILSRLLDPFERTARVVYPDHRMWVRAGAILAASPGDRARKPRLLNDCLIALSAVSIGAAVVTANRRDFDALTHFVKLTHFGSVNEALAAIG